MKIYQSCIYHAFSMPPHLYGGHHRLNIQFLYVTCIMHATPPLWWAPQLKIKSKMEKYHLLSHFLDLL